jgi:hypothetical protein
MILILILASLAAVYYIAPLPEPAVKPQRQPPKREAATLEAATGATAVLTPGLVPLGRALDQHGRGREPMSATPGAGEEVRKTERDRL